MDNIYANRNNITIAFALRGKNLTKIVYSDGSEKAYDNAYEYKFFNRDVYGLNDILPLVKYLLHRPQCCVIRGVCKDDSLIKQRRIIRGSEATIIEQPQNWYALDVDNYGECSGDLRADVKTVLLALNLEDTEAFAIPSSGYLRKPGIRIRIFLWNETKVSCESLKKHFEQYKSIVDTKIFEPIQPIYIARPIFNGMSDPCNNHIVWINGNNRCSNIVEIKSNYNNRNEYKYTKKQAERFFKSILNELPHISDGHRHSWLIEKSIVLGKWIGQEILDEEDVVEELYNNCQYFWGGNKQKDMQTIVDGIQRGKLAMENSDDD